MPVWRSLGELFHRPYMEHLWVLQEVVLAQEVTLICGEIALNRTLLSDLVKLIMRAGLLRLACGKRG
jgi:hypothetical protein